MNFVINKSMLLKELNLIQGVVERKNTIPILSNLLLETKGNQVVIKGTDLDVSITTSCEADVIEQGAVCVHAKKLFEIIRSLPEAEINIKCNEPDHYVSISCERSRFKMVGLNKEHFPIVNEFAGPFVALPASLLSTFIVRTLFAITSEESRYALNGVKFELSSIGVRMVATDGHRLSFIEKHDQFFGGEKVDVLIPRKTLSELMKLCTEANGVVEFGNDNNHLYFRVEKRLIISRTLSGQFPNYELVLPKDQRISVLFDTNRLSNAIKRVSLMADEKSHSVKFELTDGQVRISSQAADVGESEDILSIEYNGPAITIGFNAQYLLDFFNVINSNETILEFKDSNSQVQVKPSADTEYNFRYVVMPMRL
jgi:DNA polymerase III subunit beta